MYGEQDFTPKGVALTISLALVGTIVVMCILIPFILDGATPYKDVEIEDGGTWEYVPETNIPATYSFSGPATEYIEWDGTTVRMTAPNGYYSLTITATSEKPYQTAEKTLIIYFGDHNSMDDVFPLLSILPIFLLIGIALFVLRRTAGVGTLSKSHDPYDYDNY